MRPPPLSQLLLAMAALVAAGPIAAFAREYPLFKLRDVQQVVFQYVPVSDQSQSGKSISKVQDIQDGGEKYPFARVEFTVVPGAASPFAGIRFMLEEVRMPSEEPSLLLRLRASARQMPLTLRIKDVAGREGTAALKEFGGAETSWKYFEVPLSAFEKDGVKFRPFLASLEIVATEPGKGHVDVALIGVNAP